MTVQWPRWSKTEPCRYCAGTGKAFFCNECDVKEPGDCIHEVNARISGAAKEGE